MATFELTGPDGGTYQVDAPDEHAALTAFSSLHSHPTAPQSSPVADVAKSAGIGLAQGALGVLGMGGDVGSLLGSATDKVGGMVGASPDKVQQFKDYMRTAAQAIPGAGILTRPGSADLQKGVEKVTGDFYKPQTTAGEYARTIGEFAPAVIGGPESIGAKLVSRVAAPAIASETAGQLTHGTAAEPYARIAGALAGGAGAAKLGELSATKAAQSSVPAAEDLLKTAGKQFNDVINSDLVLHPAAVRNMAQDIRMELLDAGMHPDIGSQKSVFSTLDRLEQLGQRGMGVTPKDLEVIRKNLVSAKTDIDASTAKAARDATNSFMEKYANIGQTPGAIIQGDAQGVLGTLKDAIGNYAAGKRSNTVMGKANLAQLNADTAGSGANVDNAYRQAIKQLVRPVNNDIVPKAQRLGFNAPEIAALNTAARGTVTGNVARLIGKAAPTGIVSGALSGSAGHAIGGPIGAVALPAVGFLAKKIGDLSTKRAVAAVDSLVRSRSPLAAQVAAQLPHIAKQLSPKSAALLSALVASDQILSQSQQFAQQPR